MEYWFEIIEKHWVIAIFIFLAMQTVVETISSALIEMRKPKIILEEAYYIRCKDCQHYDPYKKICNEPGGGKERWESCSRAKLKNGE